MVNESANNCHLAVIPAAGKGDRMAGRTRKQYLIYSGKTVLEHTVDKLIASGLSRIVIAVSKNDERWLELPLAEDERITFVEGGDSRHVSVHSGISKLLEEYSENDWVMVHDAVRPCVSIADVMRLNDAVKEHEVGGLLAVRISDTIKQQAGGTGNLRAGITGDVAAATSPLVEGTVDRTGLWRALTPQMFRLGMLSEAIQRAMDSGNPITDESSAIELLGYQPELVEGNIDNIKITYPGDLKLAEYYLDRQLGQP
jgi:2-C-methyl-D-erythritol 4-phosphate cytidylyltransferase